MAWRAARSLTWAGDGKRYEFGDTVPVDVDDPRVWWLMRAGLFVVPESPADLPPGASPYSFDPVIQAANNRINRHLAAKEAKAIETPGGDSDGGNASPVAESTAPAKKAPAKKAAKKTTKAATK